MILRSMIVFGALPVLLALSGCSEPQPTTGTVKGRVTMNGKPVPGVTVTAYDTASRTGLRADTDANGAYEFRSYKEVGLAPGKYQVAVSLPTGFATAEEQAEAIRKSFQGGGSGVPELPSRGVTIPEKYQDPQRSGLVIEVVAGENPPFDFELKSQP